MPADYNIPMTDAQITEALQLMVERVSEGWAQETYDGSPVGSGSPYYHKSSKWWATQAADAAARAEAAVPAGTAGAVFFDRAQSLTDAQQEQARQNIKAGGSNRNLLDNPFFAVNQRDFTSSTTTSAVKTVDRWLINNGAGGTTSLNPDGSMHFIANSGSSTISFQQNVEGDFTGKTLTATALFSDGSIVSATGVAPARTTAYRQFAENTTTKPGFKIGMLATPTSLPYGYIVQIITAQGKEWNIKAIKLEYGSVSTLANDAPPNYAEELAKCQRYFYRLGKAQYTTIATVLVEGNGNAYGICMLPQTMRAKPTVTVTGSPILFNGSTNYVAVSSVAINSYATMATPDRINLVAATATAVTAGNRYELQFRNDTNACIDFSADL